MTSTASESDYHRLSALDKSKYIEQLLHKGLFDEIGKLPGYQHIAKDDETETDCKIYVLERTGQSSVISYPEFLFEFNKFYIPTDRP